MATFEALFPNSKPILMVFFTVFKIIVHKSRTRTICVIAENKTHFIGGSITDSNLIEDWIYLQVEHLNIMECVLFEIRFLQQQRRPKMVLQTFCKNLMRFGHTRWTSRVLFKVRRLNHINNVSDRKKSFVKILYQFVKKHTDSSGKQSSVWPTDQNWPNRNSPQEF